MIVMKFGGTSLADPEKIQRAAQRAVSKAAKEKVVVVVSAPGEMTDELLNLAFRIAPAPSKREIDQLISTGEQVGAALFAMACQKYGFEAVSLTAAQAGINARGLHTEASISAIRPRRIIKEARKKRVVVVSGFQGLGKDGDVLTLGRGGSDLTAVALAAALKAEICEIFTDVKGIYTADPRVVSEARLLQRISMEEMSALSRAGAQVMQDRALLAAEKSKTPLHVRSAFHGAQGTWILPHPVKNSGKPVSALALSKNPRERSACVSAVGQGAGKNAALKNRVLESLSRRGISVSQVALNPIQISVRLPIKDAESALRLIHKACRLG